MSQTHCISKEWNRSYAKKYHNRHSIRVTTGSNHQFQSFSLPEQNWNEHRRETLRVREREQLQRLNHNLTASLRGGFSSGPLRGLMFPAVSLCCNSHSIDWLTPSQSWSQLTFLFSQKPTPCLLSGWWVELERDTQNVVHHHSSKTSF